MAIALTDIQFYQVGYSSQIPDAVLNNLFPDATVTAVTSYDYGWVEIQNTHATLTLTSPKFWFGVDPVGVTVAAAVADGGVARPLSYSYSLVALPGGFTTPTDSGTGLALPTLAAQQKCCVVIRRDTNGASAAYPERNSFTVQGTSPI